MAVETSSMRDSMPPSEPRRPGVWGGLLTVLLYFVAQLAVMAVLSIAMGLVYGLREAGRGHKFSADAMLALFRSPNVIVWLTVVDVGVAAALMLFVIRHRWRASWAMADPPGFGFVRPRRGWWFVVAVVASLATAYLGGRLTEVLARGHVLHQDVSVMARHASLVPRLTLLLLVVCVAPLVEELIFRGVLLSGLMRRMSVVWAVLISAALFGGVHLLDFKFAWYPIPALFLFGVVLAWLRLQSRSLWVSISGHAANNLVAGLSWFVAVHPHS